MSEQDAQRSLEEAEELVRELQEELNQTNRELLGLTIELEDRVAARTAELERSNEELEQFAFVVSHDLQEPLRTITGFLGLLETRSRDKLDDKERSYLRHVVGGAERMRHLIADLLEYSRVGTQGRELEPVDTGRVLDEVVEGLLALLESSGGRIERGELPTVHGDPLLLAQLFQNLLGNALKFRGESAPQVRVEARWSEGRWELSVRDNGIGFPPDQADRIFQVFQRLHGRDAYPGTGIGLAICRRIVRRHGGWIWAESEPGEGTTFLFTLPSCGSREERP